MRIESLLGACLRHHISIQRLAWALVLLEKAFSLQNWLCICSARFLHLVTKMFRKPEGIFFAFSHFLSNVYEWFFHTSFHFILLLSHAVTKPSSSLDISLPIVLNNTFYCSSALFTMMQQGPVHCPFFFESQHSIFQCHQLSTSKQKFIELRNRIYSLTQFGFKNKWQITVHF